MNTQYAINQKTHQTAVPQTTEQKEYQNSAQEDISFHPLVDIVEDNNGITLIADLPGVNKEALNIHVEDDNLVIEGDISSNHSDENIRMIYTELSATRYKRLFTLSRELDASKVEAEFNDGVLTLHIPKAAHAQPKKIEIKVA
jgi:HSP20 family molecular chaperone IbpA